MQIGPSPRRRALRPVFAAAAAAVLASGCTGPADGGGGAEQQRAEEGVFDPPTEFDASAGVRIDVGAREGVPLPPIDGETVYYADEDGLHAHDGLDDRELWSAAPDQPVHGVRPDGAVLAEIDDRPVVIGAFLTRNPGAGDAVAQERLEVLAVDAGDGEPVWHREVIPSRGGVPDADDVFVVGADGDAVVVSYGTAFAFDPADGEPLWSDPGVRPEVLQDGSVVGWEAGSAPGALTALSARDGSPEWTLWGEDSAEEGRPRYAAPMGGGLVLVAREAPPSGGAGPPEAGGGGAERPGGAGAEEPSPGERAVEWAAVHAGSGEVAYWPDPLPDQVCRYDEQSLLACWSDGTSTPAVQVYTADTGDLLWSDEKLGGGVPTSIRGVWHGLLYADRGLEGAAAGIYSLDFQNDLGLDPGVAPDSTNGVLGLRRGGGGKVTAYPATG
ncbi:PQQ-binding-like beta-propeller repeat protein [Nocardiopsis sp. CNT-189]|uniref:outer membrane protein assembly factor BamB family protein n=1 Tax=Nocardiopsis oceanisediminis TaxID=2816862 RepID=UPI003B3874DA